MRVTVPDYYEDFHCLAGACPHTCCEKWEVVIDGDSAAFYETVPGPLGEKLRTALKQDEDGDLCFPLNGGRCPFLDDENLCEIHKSLGEEATSVTCREHPRFTEDYGPFREVTLSASCPAANALLLGSEAPLTFHTFETEEEGDISGPPQQPSEAGAVGRGGTRELGQFSPQRETEQSGLEVNCPAGARETPLGDCDDEGDEWLNYLLPLRARLLDILTDRSRPLRSRLVSFLALALSAQDCLDDDRPEGLENAEETALPPAEGPLFPTALEFLASLEVLDADWPALLKQAAVAEKTPQPEALLERIAVYFAFRYLLKTVNDGDLLSRAELVVFAVLTVERLAAVCGLPEALRRFSAEIEHDDDNLEALLETLRWRFGPGELVTELA